MTQQIEQAAAGVTKVGSAVAAVSGVSNFLVENVALFSVVGVLSGIVFALVGVYFQFRRDVRDRRSEARDRQLYELQVKKLGGGHES